jgi:hypothetical protein
MTVQFNRDTAPFVIPGLVSTLSWMAGSSPANGIVIGIVSNGDFQGMELDRLDEETGLWEGNARQAL